MPRKRPTYVEGGPGAPIEAPPNMMQAPSQPPVAPTGMPYGEHQASIEAQQEIPLPNNDPFARAMMAAQQIDLNAVPNLYDDSEFPDEPITAGMSMGPGPGPGIVAPRDAGRVALTLDLIAQVTGSPDVARLAQAARAKGR